MAGNPFWTWSLRLYRRPNVAASCVGLQDRAGIEVNLLLFCLWSGSRRVSVSGATMSSALRVSREWSAAVVRPLRDVRRSLKGPAQSSATLQSFRRRVAALELEAEHLQQDTLAGLLRNGTETDGEPAMIAADNLALYFRRAGIRLAPRDWAALKVIVRAAF